MTALPRAPGPQSQPVHRILGPDLSDLGLGPEPRPVAAAQDERGTGRHATTLDDVMGTLLAKCDALLDWAVTARVIWSVHRQMGEAPVHIALAYAPEIAPENDKQIVTEGRPGVWPATGVHARWPAVSVYAASRGDLAAIFALSYLTDLVYDEDIVPYRDGTSRPAGFVAFEVTPDIIYASCVWALSEFGRDSTLTPRHFDTAIRQATWPPGAATKPPGGDS